MRPCYNKLPIDIQVISQILHLCYCSEVIQRGRGDVLPVEELGYVARWLHVSTPKPWLIIYGSVGNGKTTTARAIKQLYETLRKASKESLEDRYALRLQGKDFVMMYEQLEQLQQPQLLSAQDISTYATSNQELYAQVKSSPMLIIDDMGIEPIRVLNYGTEISPIAEVLFYRYERNMTTILTTNKNFEQLSDAYGDRIADRLVEVASRIGYNASSYRGKQVEK